MTNYPFIGRRESVGIAPETTPGTAVAPVVWGHQLKFDLNQKTTVAQDKTALGRVEDVQNSTVTEQWAEGTLQGDLEDQTIGYLLAAMYGTVASALDGSETAVWNNTYTVSQSAPPQTLTFVRTNPLYEGRYPMGTLTDLEFDCSTGGYVEFTATFVTLARTTSTDTVAYVTQNKFTSKYVSIKWATTVDGLSGATAIQPKSFKLKISRKADRFTPLGTITPVAFDPESFGVTGELVTRFTDTTLETAAFANTLEAMSISIVNTDTTIGSASNPSLVFTMPQVRFTPINLDDNLDQPLTQTIPFVCEYSTSAGYMCQPVLTTTTDSF